MMLSTSRDETTLVLRRIYAAPRPRVYHTWTDPAIQNRPTPVTVDLLTHNPTCTELILTHASLTTPGMHTIFTSGWPTLLAALATQFNIDSPERRLM